MILSEVNDDWYKHGEGLVLVCLQDVKEVVILKEAHGTIGYLQVVATNWFHNTLEESRDEGLKFVDFAYLKYLL